MSRSVLGMTTRLTQVRAWVLVDFAIGLGALGVATGSLPLTAVEPDAASVDCGSAVFGRPSPLPDALCGSAYNQLPIPLTFLTYALIILAVATVSTAIVLEITRLRARALGPSPFGFSNDLTANHSADTHAPSATDHR